MVGFSQKKLTACVHPELEEDLCVYVSTCGTLLQHLGFDKEFEEMLFDKVLLHSLTLIVRIWWVGQDSSCRD